MHREPTYLEKVESYLVDDFHHGLHRILIETIWSDVRVGAWANDIDFFACLEREYEYLLTIRSKPLQLEMHLRDLNFSGQQFVNGAREKFLASRLPCSRQKILLYHCLQLMFERRTAGNADLTLLLRALRREIHQSLRFVFFNLQGDWDPHGLQDFIDQIDRFEWLTPKDTRLLLATFMSTWLERQGVKGSDVNSLNKLQDFFLLLTRWLSYHPKQTPGPPPQFGYGSIFQDWQKVRFFSSLHYECDRLITLSYLEGLSHSPAHTKDVLTGVGDRSSFESEIDRWMIRSRSDGQPFVLAMFDIDDFKGINTAYGHVGGDVVLKNIAELFKAQLASDDFMARWGDKGDEFVLLLKRPLTDANTFLRTCISNLATTEFQFESNGTKRPIKATVSCGLAEFRSEDDKDRLVRKANDAMHEAKNEGKNRVVVSPAGSSTLERIAGNSSD